MSENGASVLKPLINAVRYALEAVHHAPQFEKKLQYSGKNFLTKSSSEPLNRDAKNKVPSALATLTVAALALPGLGGKVLASENDDEVDFQYSHYQEGKRDLYAVVNDQVASIANNLNPIEVDSIHGSAKVSLTDHIRFAFNYLQDTWSGATPISTASALSNGNRPIQIGTGELIGGASPIVGQLVPIYIDKNQNFYQAVLDSSGTPIAYRRNNQLVDTMTSASPETRRQGDFKLIYDWDEATIDIGGGLSIEPDYESRFANIGGRLDLNQKRTTLNLGLSYTSSDTHATLDPDSYPFIARTLRPDFVYDSRSTQPDPVLDFMPTGYEQSPFFKVENGSPMIKGSREDWGVQLGLIQVLNKDALLTLDAGYMLSNGYMANPYKLVTVYQSEVTESDFQNGPFQASAQSFLEKRPEVRNVLNLHAGFTQYIAPLDAAIHLNYRFAHDDWDITAHTFEADWVQPLGTGWTVTPRVRYYSQSSADFYYPYVFNINILNNYDAYARINSPFNRPLPQNYSSDQRLSAFGALSGGLIVSKQFTKGITLEAGIEYYTHAGALRLGGGGEGSYADFNYFSANAALKANLSALGAGGGDGSAGHIHHQHGNAPAGVMFDHALKNSGDFMLGYRYMHGRQAGDMLYGDTSVSLQTVRFNACGDSECQVSPKEMTMNMHMLDLMYAPFDWLTLMLMPQFVDMDMTMTPLTHEAHKGGTHQHGGSTHHHATGGVGDTGLYALFKLFERPGHHIVLTLGGTAPTGDVDIMLRKTNTTQLVSGVPVDYGMQLGSGTWDFKPTLAYSGENGNWLWGAQAGGTKRLEDKNSSGYALGDVFQSSLWGGYCWTEWLSTTVRGIYTWQDTIKGEYPPVYDRNGNVYHSIHAGPFDFTANYGGNFVDLGLGVNVTVPHGAFAGNTLKFEWLQPIYTDFNGYQLDRDGALAANWSYGF